MKIWRVETRHGEGPYQVDLEDVVRSNDLHAPTFMEQDPERHPHPANDGFRPEGVGVFEYRIPQDMSFGFALEESLKSWFFPRRWDAELMEDLGLCVRVFEVDEEHTQLGYSQAMFRKDLAKLVAEYSPTEYAGTRG